MKRIVGVGMALTVALLMPTCGTQRQASETALAQAVTAYNAIKPQAMNVDPEQAKAIETAITAATSVLQQGDYKAALQAANGVAEKVKQLSEALPGKLADLQSAWTELSNSLPGTLATLERKLRGVHAPAAGTPGAADSPAAVLARLKTEWGEAESAEQAGRLAEAVGKANEVREGAVRLLTDLQTGS